MNKLYIYLLFFAVMGIRSAEAQSIFIPNGKTSISLGNDAPIAFAGGAVVAADTLSGDTLYIGGDISGYYRLARAKTVANVNMQTASVDTTEMIISNSLALGNGHLFDAGASSGLTLLSTPSGTGRIETIPPSSSIAGQITQQRYIPGGKRAYRMISHPFSSPLSLTSALIDDIDVTGAGGAANGFTPTATNNPSAYWFNAPLGDTQIVLLNPGWTAFGSANTASWLPNQSLNVMIRGAKGQGLNSQTYVPQEVTLDFTGSVNQGDVTVPMFIGPGNNRQPTPHSFNIVGNPYPSPIQLKRALDALSNKRGAAYFVWNPNIALNYNNQNNMMAYGKYQTLLFADEYSLPSSGSFCVDITAPENITFLETDKTEAEANGLFRTTAASDIIELQVFSDTGAYFWDNMYVTFNSSASDSFDNFDGSELLGGGVNLFAFTLDGLPVSVYGAPYDPGKVIPLGFPCTEQRQFDIRVTRYQMDPSKKVYLYDKYLNTTTLLDSATSYSFQVTADTASSGNRFQLGLDPTVVQEAASQAAAWALYPNPASDVLTLRTTRPTNTNWNIYVCSMQGQVLHQDVLTRGAISTDLSVAALPAGIYQLTVRSTDGAISSLRFVKQ